MADMESSVAPVRTRGEVLAEISRAVVQLHRRYYGKGPTKAKTHAFDARSSACCAAASPPSSTL